MGGLRRTEEGQEKGKHGKEGRRREWEGGAESARMWSTTLLDPARPALGAQRYVTGPSVFPAPVMGRRGRVWIRDQPPETAARRHVGSGIHILPFNRYQRRFALIASQYGLPMHSLWPFTSTGSAVNAVWRKAQHIPTYIRKTVWRNAFLFSTPATKHGLPEKRCCVV